MTLGREVVLGSGHIVLDGDPTPNGAKMAFADHIQKRSAGAMLMEGKRVVQDKGMRLDDIKE